MPLFPLEVKYRRFKRVNFIFFCYSGCGNCKLNSSDSDCSCIQRTFLDEP